MAILLVEFAFLQHNRQDTKPLLELIKKDSPAATQRVTEIVKKQHNLLFPNEPIDERVIDDYKNCLKRYRVLLLERVNTLILRAQT